MIQTSDLLASSIRSGLNYVTRIAGLTLLTSIFPITANAELYVELEAGVAVTDNINRASDTPGDVAIDDTIFSAGIALTYEHESARSDVDVRGSLSYLEYQDGPYAAETLPALDASALFRVTEQSLSWFIVGNVGQQSTDAFQPITPGNREDIVYITTGPSITIPIGTRFRINSDVYYSTVKYDVQPLDNDRAGAQLAFVRQINPTRSIALNFTGERTEFDRDLFFPPFERYGAYLRFETEGSRNELAVEFGWNASERAGQEFEEPLVGVEWRRRLSPSLDLSVAGGTRISDAADSFRNNQQGSTDFGGSQNQQSGSSPFREDYASMTLTRSGERTTASAGLSWRDQDYEQTTLIDRQMTGIRLDISRRLSSAWRVSAFGTFDNLDYGTIDREDDDTGFGTTLTYSRFRTLEFELRVERIDRGGSQTTDEYTENRGYLGFRYIPELGR